MDSSQAGREFFPRARVSILSAYIGTYLYVGTRAPTTVARHIKKTVGTWGDPGQFVTSSLLLPCSP